MIISRVREIRQMMDEGFDCGHFPIALETRLLTIVLSSGMQLAKEESSLSNQDPKRFREDEMEIANVFEHQIAND